MQQRVQQAGARWVSQQRLRIGVTRTKNPCLPGSLAGSTVREIFLSNKKSYPVSMPRSGHLPVWVCISGTMDMFV